ncbi:hypothetical protein [Streptomyces sp. NPDC056660]|uniref:hypothetical protein n=1 Tax=Streptomyces sp. NPDC056660 TaxID=3345897 RepID=UPI0036BF801A
MATLLHLDSSLWPAGSASVSRTVTAAFRRPWEDQHPDGTVVHRDLDGDPVPHLGAAATTAGLADPAVHTPDQAAAIPSTLKAWLDQVTVLLGDGLGMDVEFIVPELTLAHSTPAMAELIPLAEASLVKAHEEAAAKGKAAAVRAAGETRPLTDLGGYAAVCTDEVCAR